MRPFIDETRLELLSGSGGNGAVSFRREKYIERGGPDGGDGGKGGSIVFAVRANLKTFSHLQNKHKFSAEDGKSGSGARKTGRAGTDCIISVPPGTRILDYKTKILLLDLGEEEKDCIFLAGGQGGLGNWHFKSNRQGRQAPKKHTPGKRGLYKEVLLELSLIADIGFVGFPNAGKSSLLKAITGAAPQIAPYPFTTRSPHLGVIQQHGEDLILADIPGIIEGASRGRGLGLRFLKHINRTAGLVFIIDISQPYAGEFQKLLVEVVTYNPQLAQKPRFIAASKLDAENARAHLEELKKQCPHEKILAFSSHSGEGLPELIRQFWQLKQET